MSKKTKKNKQSDKNVKSGKEKFQRDIGLAGEKAK